MNKSMAFALGVLLVSGSAIADDREKLIGTWRMLSFENEFQDGSPRRAVYGQHPAGYIILTAEGRMMAVAVGEGRKAATTDEERASLLRSMFAYTGKYRLEGDKWITTVDVSWNPSFGGEQIRFYKLDGDRLEVTGAWGSNVNIPGAPVTRGVVQFVRER